MRDEVIKEWQYQTPIDEGKCSGRNWLENYWLNLKVTVTPTDELVSLQQELLQKKIALKQIDRNISKRASNRSTRYGDSRNSIVSLRTGTGK